MHDGYQYALGVAAQMAIAFGAPVGLYFAARMLRAFSYAFASFAVLATLGLLYFVADWSYANVYLRDVAMAVAIIASIAGLHRTLRQGRRVFAGRLAAIAFHGVQALVVVGATLVTAACTLVFLDGLVDQAVGAVSLGNPVCGLRLYALHGGGASTNPHTVAPPQRYAVDFVGTDPWGSRTRVLLPTAVEDFRIYGATVNAPCAGDVVATQDGEPDRPLDWKANRRERPAGNFVAIHCLELDVTVLLAHLGRGLRTHAGDRVRSGQILGAVGNSGNTSEPHLHMHAVRGRVDDADTLIAGDVHAVPYRLPGSRLPPSKGDWFPAAPCGSTAPGT